MNYSNFLDLAKARYSVRKFLNKKIPKENVEKILQAGMLAPTGCNNQPQRIIVVQSDEGLAKIKECTRCHFEAPLVFIISYNKDECWKRPYDGKLSGDIDASIVTTHMMMEAAELGLGSCWVMHYRPEVLKEKFNLSDNLESTALLVCGYPAEDASPAPGHTNSRAQSELVSWE
ncbi:MAG: nitroreductase family protein [Treponema sp.]|nr:nitroreductase family protein [Treponema sp.]